MKLAVSVVGFWITTATGTWSVSRETPYPNRISNTIGSTKAIEMLLGSRRICRPSL